MTNDQIAMVLTLAYVAAGIGIFTWLSIGALRSGIFPSRYRHIRRSDRPAAFWATVSFHAAAILSLAAIGLYAVWRLATE